MNDPIPPMRGYPLDRELYRLAVLEAEARRIRRRRRQLQRRDSRALPRQGWRNGSRRHRSTPCPCP